MACVGALQGGGRWDDRFGQYGFKVSFWGSGTLKIVILVENTTPRNGFFGWLINSQSEGGVLISGHYRYSYHVCIWRGDKHRTQQYPINTEIIPDHDSGGKIGGVNHVFRYIPR